MSKRPLGWRPKSSRMLISIGKKNVIAARRKVGTAWRCVQEMQTVMVRLNRQRPIQPVQ